MKASYKISGIVILIIIAIQFIPFGKEHSNPPVVSEPQWDDARTRELFFRACADCHSNETNWPWYSSIAPISWLLQHDVVEGRKSFNISLWGMQKENEGDEAAKEVRKGKMPPWFYVIPHPEAKLSESEKSVLIKGLASTFGDEEAESEHDEKDDD